MFDGQQQTFTQSLLEPGQQNFQQVNSQLTMTQQQQNDYSLQVCGVFVISYCGLCFTKGKTRNLSHLVTPFIFCVSHCCSV